MNLEQELEIFKKKKYRIIEMETLVTLQQNPKGMTLSDLYKHFFVKTNEGYSRSNISSILKNFIDLNIINKFKTLDNKTTYYKINSDYKPLIEDMKGRLVIQQLRKEDEENVITIKKTTQDV